MTANSCEFRLVDVEEVAGLLDGGSSGREPVLLEAHFTSIDHPFDPDPPQRFHIPGAIQIHPSYLEAGLDSTKYYPNYRWPEDGNLLKGRNLASALERLGIGPDSHVVVYGTEPDGPLAAARLAWGLIYAGVAKVSMLDGGIGSWIDHGGVTNSTAKTVWDVDEARAGGWGEPRRWRTRREVLATKAEVREVALGGNLAGTKLVDVRRRGEWDGTLVDYYTFYSKAGHIPRAIHHGNWVRFVEQDSHLLAPRLQAVAARWRRLGIIDPSVEAGETELIFYCGTGWRSSLASLVAQLLGLRAKNYDEGFFGWSWDDAAPIVTRVPQGRDVRALRADG